MGDVTTTRTTPDLKALTADFDWTENCVDLIDTLTDRLVDAGIVFDAAAAGADAYVMDRLQ